MRTKAILESDVESILMHSTPKLAPLGLAIDVGGEGVVLFLLLLPTCSNGVQQAGLVIKPRMASRWAEPVSFPSHMHWSGVPTFTMGRAPLVVAAGVRPENIGTS